MKSQPIKIKNQTKAELKIIGEQIHKKFPFIRTVSYDEIIWFLILLWRQNGNRGELNKRK